MCDPGSIATFLKVVTATAAVSTAVSAKKSASAQKQAVNEAKSARDKEAVVSKQRSSDARKKSDAETIRTRKDQYAQRRLGGSGEAVTGTAAGSFGARSFFG
jgi:hypothetical protein